MENIKDLSVTDRPREKMLLNGPEALTDTELLAILLGSGTKEISVLALCSLLLANKLQALAEMSLEDLMKIKGIGSAKAATILAAMELGRRRLSTNVPKIRNEADAIRHAAPHFKNVKERLFVLVLLNRNYELLATCELKTAMPDITDILQLAEEAGAFSFGLVRNVVEDSMKFLAAETKLLTDLEAAAVMLRLKYLGRVLLE
jgi:DNA repair protein RadC